MRPLTLADFLIRANAIHKGRYCYDRAVYVKAYVKLIITCPEHGDFEQTAHSHLSGRGCMVCGLEKNKQSLSFSLDEFVQKAREIHADKNYDYRKAIYKNAHTKITIICPEHGDFEQLPNSHLNGRGCPRCADITRLIKKSWSLETFISKAKAAHPGKNYNYDKTCYINSQTRVTITCPEHGDFEQLANSHMQGQGCPECAEISRRINGRLGISVFLERAALAHPGKNYRYDKAELTTVHKKIVITCPTHGDFEQTPDGHLSGRGCKKCVGRISKPEIALTDYIRSLGFDIETDKALTSKRYDLRFDIIIESKKLLIEFNGAYWHSIAYKSKNYHLEKRKLAEAHGYQLLSIWEDDYLLKKDKIEALIRRRLLGPLIRVYARKTRSERLTLNQAMAFHSKHHLQEGKPGTASLHYALFFKDEIVAVASFDKTGILHRYTLKQDTAVIGGMGKLLAAYRTETNNQIITSYCDKDYFSGGLYLALGFVKVSESLQLTYFHNNRRYRRERFMKHKLPALFGAIDISKTEQEICFENRVFACYNSGVDKYILQSNR